MGVYFYSQAVTEEEAAEEARFVVERLRGLNVSGPIAPIWNFTRRTRPGPTISPANRPPKRPRFCDVIVRRATGRWSRTLHWAGSMARHGGLAHLPVWLASSAARPAGPDGLWQYSERCCGRDRGSVDLDLWFTKE